MAKLVARLLDMDTWIRQLSRFESRHLSKTQNRRHKQRNGQHTLVRQKKNTKQFSGMNCKRVTENMYKEPTEKSTGRLKINGGKNRTAKSGSHILQAAVGQVYRRSEKHKHGRIRILQFSNTAVV
jgi:hypothetical protein